MTTKDEKPKQHIGFIGMGHMGSHMSLRLLNAGYQLTVYDRTYDKSQANGTTGSHCRSDA